MFMYSDYSQHLLDNVKTVSYTHLGKICLQALGLGKGVILPVGHKIIVLALAQPRHVFAGSAKACLLYTSRCV